MYAVFKIVLFYFYAFNVSVYNVHAEDVVPYLQWASEYSIESEKWSLTSGHITNFKYWRTSDMSRLDSNNGTQKKIAETKRRFFKNYVVKYHIYPMTTDNVTNKYVCSNTIHSDLDELLPNDVDFYVYTGKDQFYSRNLHKFQYKYGDSEKVLLAELHDEHIWIPVRFEETTYNVRLGNVEKHIVWHFYNYNTTVDRNVFSVKDYNCTRSYGEAITNDLPFGDPDDKEHVDRVFTTFLRKYGKNYIDNNEYIMRRNIFQQNMRLITANNRNGSSGFKLGITKFADHTSEEIKSITGLSNNKSVNVGPVPFEYTSVQIKEMCATLPKEYDHRLYGRVTAVKDQDGCNSGWAFSATAAVEGALAMKDGGALMWLSNQALIDCAWGFNVSGCDGGNEVGAYSWIMKYGLPTEEEYGLYTGERGLCRIQNMTRTYKIRGYVNVPPYSVEALKVALVYHGPLSVSIHATDQLLLYTGGIYYDMKCSVEKLNLQATLVGYSQLDGEDYWIVKTSLGTHWGIDGYLHISIRDNSCGITARASYVVL